MEYVAYDAANSEFEIFATFDEAKKWLTDFNFSDGGVPAEFSTGECFIAKITHKTNTTVTDEKKNYHEHDENCTEDCIEEEWPYSNEFDFVCKIGLEPVE